MQAGARQSVEQGSAPPAGRPPTLTDRTARGVAWALAQTVAMKVLTVGVQVALAWYLVKEEFGLVAVAMSIASFAAVFQYAGVQEILVQRHAKLRVWASAAFWLNLALGV